MLNRQTGETRPPNCGRIRCPDCGMRCVRRQAALMTWPIHRVARPRLVTLTRLPVTGDGALDWQATRWQVRDLARRLHDDFRCEWAWAVEANPRGTGYHLHAVQWGDFLPQRELQVRWGGRRVDIRAIKPRGGAYVLKEAAKVAGYVAKGAASQVTDHLALNGSRVYHSTRAYHCGLTKQQVRVEMACERGESPWVLTLAT